MHVLLAEASCGDGDALADRLRGIGCQVSRCHQGSGICQSQVPAGRCPLDGRTPVDMLVDVRGKAAELTAREFGVVCALRSGVQVVVVPAGKARTAAVPRGLEDRVSVASQTELIDNCRSAMNVQALPGWPSFLAAGYGTPG